MLGRKTNQNETDLQTNHIRLCVEKTLLEID